MSQSHNRRCFVQTANAVAIEAAMFLSCTVFVIFCPLAAVPAIANSLQAGAAVVDVTPQTFPVIVTGSFLSRMADSVTSPLSARALALADDDTKLVIVVVDSCTLPRDLLDESKELASRKTGIPTDHMLISATHTHRAGSCMGGLGVSPDPNYVPFMRLKLADAIVAAAEAIEPARVGFARTMAPEYTALRRWIRRPDRIAKDPFGNETLRANMHAGRNWDDVTGESGPEDPELSLISVQTRGGKPLAVLANFSMHYFEDGNSIDADYFGIFCDVLKQKLAPKTNFVGIMSHGCSGDIWRMDYTRPDTWDDFEGIDAYANGLVKLAADAMEGIKYHDDLEVAMVERRMTMKYRTPDNQRLLWARRIVEKLGDRLPATIEEVYAREQIFLDEAQETEVVMQAIRIGDIGIASTSTETYAITGLKIKAASPLEKTMVIELANGNSGYIPPPEQHLFGGYNTWAARSAGLEVTAEPKIAASCINLLEQVTGKPLRRPKRSRGPAAKAIERMKPLAWYCLDEFAGPRAVDSTGNHLDGIYESHVTYYLEGPHSDQFCSSKEKNRAAMFVGGRLHTRHPTLSESWSVSLWIWNGMPNDGREVSGWFMSHSDDNTLSAFSTHLGIGGTSGFTGRLIIQQGIDGKIIAAGSSEIPRWTWQHVAFVREAGSVRAYLNGKQEIATSAATLTPVSYEHLFFGGRSDNSANWEGRLDEIAVFDRVLTTEEVAALATNRKN